MHLRRAPAILRRSSARRISSRTSIRSSFDSQFAHCGMHLRTIFRDGMLCTVYEPSTWHQGGDFPIYWSVWGRGSEIPHYCRVSEVSPGITRK